MARKAKQATSVMGGYARVGADWTVGFPADNAPEEGATVQVRKVDGGVNEVRVKRAVAVTIPATDGAMPTVFFTFVKIAKK